MKNHYVSIIRRGELSYIRSELEQFGLSPLEGRLIGLLKDRCCSQEELGTCLDLDKGRIARAISMLEAKGLAKSTGRTRRSGYCVYPSMKFDREKMAEFEGGC